MDSIRQNKVGRLIQRDLSEMFQKECKEFTAGAMLSVTAVRVSPDMSYARVYLSIFPSNLTEKVLESLAEKNKSIRFILGKKIGKHAADYGLDPGSPKDRAQMESIIDDILTNPDEKRKGDWRSQPGDSEFFIKGEDVVVVNDNKFVTILKGGAENARVKNARK